MLLYKSGANYVGAYSIDSKVVEALAAVTIFILKKFV